jgi:hypothetical protein
MEAKGFWKLTWIDVNVILSIHCIATSGLDPSGCKLVKYCCFCIYFVKSVQCACSAIEEKTGLNGSHTALAKPKNSHLKTPSQIANRRFRIGKKVTHEFTIKRHNPQGKLQKTN